MFGLKPEVCIQTSIIYKHSILFYSILFYSILFYSILFYSILFYSIIIITIIYFFKYYFLTIIISLSLTIAFLIIIQGVPKKMGTKIKLFIYSSGLNY